MDTNINNSNDNNIVVHSTDGDTERNPVFGYCPQCKKANNRKVWCNTCDRKALVDKFNTWTTGNKDLDSFIHETQRTATSYDGQYSEKTYLEYVPYDRFTDVKSLARGGFAKVFTAMWLDGKRKGRDDRYESIKGRTEPYKVALKVIDNSAKVEQGFIDELELCYQFGQKSCLFFPCYGITRDPETLNYALILEYFPKGDLRKSLVNTSSSKLTWANKLEHLFHISSNLYYIHQSDCIHRDIHSGNILIDTNGSHLTDFGLTRPVVESLNSTDVGTYGVMPYMAPELFRGEMHSKASDIYAFGIIMSEYALDEPAFYDRNHDLYLQFEIIDGLRPEVPPETPQCYKELMSRCVSGDPLLRPTAGELHGLFYAWGNLRNNNEVKQFEMADKQWKQKQPKKRHPGAVYTSRLISYTTTVTTASSTSKLPTSREATPLCTSDFEIYKNDNDDDADSIDLTNLEITTNDNNL